MRQLRITRQITQRTDDSIDRYFQEVEKYPLISPEEEVELTVRMRKGDPKALEQLVQANLRFVISVAKQFINHGLSFPDLINEGNLGLIKAASRFDETRGFKFISYAVWWIRQSIIQAISEQTRIVRLPLNRVTSINKIRKSIPHLEQELEREPTDVEIAEFLNMASDDVKLANKLKDRQVSFDRSLVQDDQSETNLYDVFQTDNTPSPDDEIMKESLRTNINRALDKLSRKEADIISLSFGLGDGPVCSLQEIAAKYGISAERIRQIKSKGLFKLKILFEDKYSFFES